MLGRGCCRPLTPDTSQIPALLRERFGAGLGVDEIVALAGDASTRRYVRARLRGPDAPATAIVMILADSGQSISSDELAVFEKPPRELPFVNVHRFLRTLGVSVPEIYLDASPRGFVVLEDVGDTTLWDAASDLSGEALESLYRRAVDQLLSLVLDGTRRRDDGCIAFQQAFDERLFLWEFEHFIEYGIEKRLRQALPPSELAELRHHFAAIAARLGAAPRFLAHRDFHSWNLFVQDGRVRVIDFQDALLAPATYDLATLLGDRDTRLRIDSAAEADLLGYYHRQWQARGGPDWPASALQAEYFDCALQKAFKVVGRFHYLDMVKGKPGYLRYLPATWRQIDRLLDRDPALADVRAILARHADELR